MRTATYITVLFFVLMHLAGFAHAENWLQGQILENHGDTKKPAPNAQVWIVNVGNPYLTQADGGYRVLVPDAYRIGQTITLFIKRKGWAIATPVGGKVELKKDFTSDILLLPDESSEFLSLAQLEKLLESLPAKLKNQVKPDGRAGEADPTQVVREYASDHGLPEGGVSAKVAELVKQYEQSIDLGKQCLAAIYRKNLEQAARLCNDQASSKVDVLKKKRQEVETLSKGQLKSNRTVDSFLAEGLPEVLLVPVAGNRRGDDARHPWRPATLFVEAAPGKSTAAQLEDARRQLIKLTEEVVGEFKATGDTYYANYQFDNALTSYKEGLGYVEKRDLPSLWADMQWVIGMANWQIGIRTKDAAIQEHLSEAVNRYVEARTVYTKTDFPEAWAALQNNLGAVLRDQGIRTGGEEGTRLLAQAIAAYREALTVFTKEQLPQDWAMTQSNLSNVLQSQGIRTVGEDGSRLLAESVATYREALTVRTKEQLPQQWATTQSNLGVVLRAQGARTVGENASRLLAESVAAYREALTVFTKEQLPQDWARSQNNLGNVLSDQGIRTVGEAGSRLIRQAITAYELALEIRTREALPVQWEETTKNLKIAKIFLETAARLENKSQQR